MNRGDANHCFERSAVPTSVGMNPGYNERIETTLKGLPMRCVLLTVGALILTGCAAHRGILPPGQSAAPSIDRLCVLTATDGSYGDEAYVGSGRELSGRILAILRQGRLWQSILVPATDNTAGARQCLAEGVDYMLAPTILHWEDRATQWSGLRDYLTIDLALFRLQPYGALRRGTYTANNSWFTLVNNPPEDLLDDNFAAFVGRLVGMTPQ